MAGFVDYLRKTLGWWSAPRSAPPTTTGPWYVTHCAAYTPVEQSAAWYPASGRSAAWQAGAEQSASFTPVGRSASWQAGAEKTA